MPRLSNVSRTRCSRLLPITPLSRVDTMKARSNGNFMRFRLKLNLVPGPHTLLLTLICQRQSLSREQTYSRRVSGRAVHGYGRIEGSEHRSRARTVLACDMCVKKKLVIVQITFTVKLYSPPPTHTSLQPYRRHTIIPNCITKTLSLTHSLTHSLTLL